MTSRNPIRCGALLALGVLPSGTWAIADEVENIESSMNWSNPAGWSSRSVPGSNQRVVISSGTVTVTGTNAIGYLTLGGTGSLTGNGTLVLTGTTSTSEWSGGVGMSNLTLQIATGAQLNISGTNTSNRTIDGATLSGSGTVKWTGGRIRVGNASLINVGTFLDATTDGTINADMGGPPGTLRVAAGHTFLRQGTGTSTINIYFENFGLVSFLSGNVLLQGGSFFSGDGVVNLADNTELRLGGSGAHQVNLDGFGGDGTIVIAGGKTTLDGRANVRVVLNAGEVGGDFVVGHKMIIAGGKLMTGATTIAKDAQLSFQSLSQLDFTGRHFTTQPEGNLRWQSGHLLTGNGGGITNHGNFEITHAGI